MKTNIVLGVTGSIAAYKAAELASRLKDRDYNVYPILTEDAKTIISQLTFDTLSQKRQQTPIPHVDLATLADLIVIAPATANTIGKIANGIADNLLTTTVMAANCPVIIAPAMNTNMWNNNILQNNIKFLKEQRYFFVDTEEGDLACGLKGKGRLAKTEKILKAIEKLLNKTNTNN